MEDSDFDCGLCREILAHPVTLACQHTYCSACVEAIPRNGARFPCPACRSETDARRVAGRKNYILCAALERGFPESYASACERRPMWAAPEAEAGDRLLGAHDIATLIYDVHARGVRAGRNGHNGRGPLGVWTAVALALVLTGVVLGITTTLVFAILSYEDISRMRNATDQESAGEAGRIAAQCADAVGEAERIRAHCAPFGDKAVACIMDRIPCADIECSMCIKFGGRPRDVACDRLGPHSGAAGERR